MSRFKGELIPLVEKLSRTGRRFVVLSDCRDYPVQSAEIGVAWSRVLGDQPLIRVPYAVVVGSMLNKLQAERALTAPNVRVFTSLAEASTWLEASRGEANA